MVALAVVSVSSDRVLALTVYSAAVTLYALSAWAFREPVFLYPAAWLAVVPYYLGMTLTRLPSEWYGLGWFPLITTYVVLGRFVFQRKKIKDARSPLAVLTHPSTPFYLLAYPLSVLVIALSRSNPLTLTLAQTACAALYLASASLFRRSVWLYPGLLAAHAALITTFTISPSGRPERYITLPFLGMTWVMALIGYGFNRWQKGSSEQPTRYPFLKALLTPSWAQPFFLLATLDLVFWQTMALLGPDTAIVLATGNAVLLGLFAMLWRDRSLAYGTLGLFLLAVGYRLGWAGVDLAEAFAWVGGIGFGMYLVAQITEQYATYVYEQDDGPLAVWPRPLTYAAVCLTSVAAAFTLPMVVIDKTAVAATTAFAGALCLAIAYRSRTYPLGYFGMALLQVAWVLVLIDHKVTQPQWYAIPAGLYFTGVGTLERRRRPGLFSVLVENFGLAVLLVTSFAQSLDGETGFPYFVLLMGEGLLVIWWGASQRLKVPFGVGFVASGLNIVAQLVMLVYVQDVNPWFIILGVGLLLVTAYVLFQWQRERIVGRIPRWFEESWT
jgi:hypothetical protein